MLNSRPNTAITAFFLAGLYAVPFVFAQPPLFIALYALLLMIPLIWLSIVDFATYHIPDPLNLGVALLGLVYLLHSQTPILPHAVAAMFSYGLLWIVAALFHRYRGYAGLGLGDAKLLAAGAFWVGPLGLAPVLLLASISGVAAVLVMRVVAKRALTQPLAFGPFLAFAIFVIWLGNPPIFDGVRL